MSESVSAPSPLIFDRLWDDPANVIVIDAYEGNAIDWDLLVTDARIVGVIHRASMGMRADTEFSSRAVQARRRGLLWGAYHLGVAGDAIAQADFFLETVGDTGGVLLALDLETLDDPRNMDVAGAIVFIERVRARTGRLPILYANRDVTLGLSADRRFAAAFADTRLWYARFRPSFPASDLGLWQDFLFWQFSSEINCDRTGTCLYNPPGVAFDMDINVFAGDRTALAQAWAH